jgi:hypothetical protein
MTMLTVLLGLLDASKFHIRRRIGTAMGPVKIMLTKRIGGHHQHVGRREAVFAGSTDAVEIVAKPSFDDEDIYILPMKLKSMGI